MESDLDVASSLGQLALRAQFGVSAAGVVGVLLLGDDTEEVLIAMAMANETGHQHWNGHCKGTTYRITGRWKAIG